MASFHLSKWYLDSVTESGDITVVYTGNVRWGAVRLDYSSILQTADDRVHERHSPRRHSEPQAAESGISWASKILNFECVWQGASSPARETVYESDKGSIDWNCLMPLAFAKSGKQTGMGYVEHLTMTIPPWKLPIQSLRWGRFTSQSESVTWLDWQGKFSRRLLYVNGLATACSTIHDGRVEGQEGITLSMDRSFVLRDGPLGTTALAGVPGIGRTFPARLLQIRESKWRSRARLERKGRPAVEGWAIHEKVSWQ